MKGDMISKQAAVESVCMMLKNCFNATDEMLESVKITVGELPPAQPEIMRCKDCRYNNDCEIQYSAQSGDEFFCGCADGKDNG